MTLGKVGIVVAARTSSTRLPGKALLPLHGLPMAVFLLRRLRGVRGGTVILATTDLPADNQLADAIRAEGVPVFRGADADVVARYVGAARQFGFDTIARVTADCPLLDAELVDGCIDQAAGFDRFDLATTKGKFPVGLDVEIYRAELMAELDGGNRLTEQDREHLTLHFYDHCDEFSIRPITPPEGWAQTSRHFTIDTPADYENAKALVARIGRADFPVPMMLEAAR